MNKKYRLRILLTILCALLAYSAFTFPTPPQSISVKVSPEKTISTTYDNGSKFFEWLGLLFLALSVWIWRRELKLTGFGPFSGEALEQQTPDDFRKDESGDGRASGFQQEIAEAMTQMKEEEHEGRKQKILDLFKKRHAINATLVAHDLGITIHAARAILFILVKEGKLRCDGYPRSSLYTLASSLENLALDHIRFLIRAEHEIDSERRFVRVKRIHEIDGVIVAGDTTYLTEVKYVQQSMDPSILDRWLLQLITISRDFNAVSIVGILAIVVFDDSLMTSVQKIVNRITYDAGEVEIRIHVFSKKVIEKAQNQALDSSAG